MIQPKNKRYPSIRAEADHVRRLEKAAEKSEVSTSEFVRRTIEKELARLSRRFPELGRKAA